MKKILFYALAACAALSVGCSKDAGIDQEVAADGKYTLPAITASLDDAETRTGLGTNQVVNWSNNDRIAVINTTTNTIYYYVLTSGSGTPVGKFEPVNALDPATFNNLSDIKAVYPAIAAAVNGGKITVTLNNNKAEGAGGYSEEKRLQAGITSWTPNSSAYGFSTNDIKVSYSTTMKTSGSTAAVNFKFRQLATWCNFVFDFTTDENYRLETMENFKVTTTAGTKKISGTAEIDFSDPSKPKLGEGTETAIEWKKSNSLGGQFTVQLMLFPVIEGTENDTKTGDQMKFEITTALHKYTFYATPSTSLTAGTVLRFPFNVNGNFEKQVSASTDDFSYAVEDGDNLPPAFYFYGKANCLLLYDATATDHTNVAMSGSLDIKPYKTNAYYWVDGDPGADIPTSVPKAASAKVIWREAGITAINVALSSDKTKLEVSGVTGNGNALVGIYDSSNNLLWSYHIWKPEIDVAGGALTYNYTNSGSYEVMPIALGATNKTTVAVNGNADAADAANAKALGLFYQWGRKDPLGRPSKVNAGADDFVATVDASGVAYNLGDATREKELKEILGITSGTSMDEKEVTLQDGTKKDVPVDTYMIHWAMQNPTVFIKESNNINGVNYNWTGKINDYLWGNPQGYNFPRKNNVKRSIFDPCPAGYRVAPKDLWISFTSTGNNATCTADDVSTWAGTLFNILNLSADKKSTTMDKQKGYFFCYETNTNGTKKWQTGNTDFYPASGYRNRSNGSASSVGSYGFYWSSSPYSAGDTYAGGLRFGATEVKPFNYNNRAYGFTVRCVRE